MKCANTVLVCLVLAEKYTEIINTRNKHIERAIIFLTIGVNEHEEHSKLHVLFPVSFQSDF